MKISLSFRYFLDVFELSYYAHARARAHTHTHTHTHTVSIVHAIYNTNKNLQSYVLIAILYLSFCYFM